MNLGRVDSPPVKVAAPATSASDFNYHDQMKKDHGDDGEWNSQKDCKIGQH